jgi:hypothetical protein
VDYCVVGGRKGTLKFLHMHLGGHVITSTQLQIFVSYWCTELNYLWGSPWETYWKVCATEILMSWDPEISEFLSGFV